MALVAGLAVQGVAHQCRVSEVGASPIRQGCQRVVIGCAYKRSYFVKRLCLYVSLPCGSVSGPDLAVSPSTLHLPSEGEWEAGEGCAGVWFPWV